MDRAQSSSSSGRSVVLQQFIGLRDWKGAPIFEGHKVMATYKEEDVDVSSPGIVQWYDREAMYGIWLGEPDGAGELWPILKFRALEVIGNIYETAELLN